MKSTLYLSLAIALSIAFPLAVVAQPAPPEQQANFQVATLTLLPGYANKTEQGIDTIVGHITREGSAYTIGYDIGMLAGDYANRTDEGTIVWHREQPLNGNKAKFIMVKQGGKSYLLASIYATGIETRHSPANFSAPIETESDLADAFLMLQSFRWTLPE